MVAVSSRQKGQNERGHNHLSSIYRVEVLGDGVSTGTNRSRRRTEMKDIREIRSSLLPFCAEYHNNYRECL